MLLKELTLRERLALFDFGLVNLIVSKLLSPSLARAGRALERGILKDEALAEGGTHEQRLLAYEALRRSCVELRTVLQILYSLPLRRLASIVSLPLRWRLIHRLPELSVAVNDALLGVAMVGRREAVEAAATLVSRLQALAEERNRAGSQPSRKARSAPDWQSFDVTLSQFVSVARSDLGIRPLNMQEPVGHPS